MSDAGRVIFAQRRVSREATARPSGHTGLIPGCGSDFNEARSRPASGLSAACGEGIEGRGADPRLAREARVLMHASRCSQPRPPCQRRRAGEHRRGKVGHDIGTSRTKVPTQMIRLPIVRIALH
jgi:hypothetical protein